jgi:hypothetical protein
MALHGLFDIGRERIGARDGNTQDRLAFHAGGCVKGRAGCHEGGLGPIGFELFYK